MPIRSLQHRHLSSAASAGFLVLLAATAAPPVHSAGLDDLFKRGFVVIVSRSDSHGVVHPLPLEAFSSLSPAAISQGSPIKPDLPASKIHPLLAARLNASRPEEQADLVITFHDQLRPSRFPQLTAREDADSPSNQAAMAEAGRLVEQIRASRQPMYAARELELAPLGVQVLETFWLIDAMRVRAPLAAIEELAKRPDVQYIQPTQTPYPPPDGDPNNDVADARAYIRTDTLAGIASGGFVGLLDSGVRATHTLLSGPSPLRYTRDCVNGTTNNCATGVGLNPDDDTFNHGTSTAAIITGNSNLGDAYRGVDWVTLDSFKVYPTGGGLDTSAAVRGFQAAVAVLDQVIVAEMQGGGTDSGAISTAADAAYDAGAIVVAANGNSGPGVGTVNEPAVAHKVIGVGAFDLETLAQFASQSRGPAPDGRIKPDVQAPTDSETASTASSTALHVFTGTSGATPYVGAMAIALRNWLASTGAGTASTPGDVYAWLILLGQKLPPFDNTAGAGPTRFVENGLFWRGETTLTPSTQVDVPLDTFGLSFPYNLTAAIWWPEAFADTHDDVDLSIVDPGGVVRASSTSTTSVFERAQVPGVLASGTWKLRIQNKGSRTQDVFFGAYRTSSP